MLPFSDFQNSIASARSLIAMYKELRKFRKLGQRGRLTAMNEDLLWLPRSAVVASLSSLDAYVHAVILDRAPVALKVNPIPPALCKEMAEIIPIKNSKSFSDAMQIIAAPDIYSALVSKLEEQLSVQTYQAPGKISAGYDMIGFPDVFGSVSALWQGRRSTADDLKRTLSNYVKRRNQIAHEGDRERSGAVRHMQPEYAEKCADFVENLVRRMNQVVYHVP
jgi:hypothetical protein